MAKSKVEKRKIVRKPKSSPDALFAATVGNLLRTPPKSVAPAMFVKTLRGPVRVSEKDTIEVETATDQNGPKVISRRLIRTAAETFELPLK